MPQKPKHSDPFVVVTRSVPPLDLNRTKWSDEHIAGLTSRLNADALVRFWGEEKTESLPSDKLVKTFDDAIHTLGEMFEKAENTIVGPLHLDTVEVNLEVSAEGKLAFLGTGGSVAGKSSFTLTFKRPDSSSSKA